MNLAIIYSNIPILSMDAKCDVTVTCYLRSVLISAIDEIQFSASRPDRFTSGEGALSTHRTGLETSDKTDVLPLSGLEQRFLGHPVRTLDTVLTELFWLPNKNKNSYTIFGHHFSAITLPHSPL